jgi:hypothetical protein
MDENLKKLNDFLESHVVNETRIQVSKKDKEELSEKDIFKEEITELIDRAFCKQDPNNRLYDIHKINDILVKYGINYELISIRMTASDRKTYWQVIRCDRNTYSEQ